MTRKKFLLWKNSFCELHLNFLYFFYISPSRVPIKSEVIVFVTRAITPPIENYELCDPAELLGYSERGGGVVR